MSSTCSVMLGKTSDAQAPDLPYCFHLNGDASTFPLVVKKPVFVSAPSNFWPLCFCSLGL